MRFALDLPGPSQLILGERTLLMGIVNCTPDSFSDGGMLPDPQAAARYCEQLVSDGADLLDIGGESTRPGAAPVSEDEQLERVLPVIRHVAQSLPHVMMSIDTRSARVAREAVEAGAVIVNDVSGLSHDPAMRATVAELGAPAIVMHMRGVPADMSEHTTYGDFLGEVVNEQRELLDAARQAGVRDLIADPGIGFAKTAEQSVALLAALPAFLELGVPVLVGPSRKSFLERFTVEDPAPLPPPPEQARRDATVAAVALCAFLGAHIVRVHDVASCHAAVRLADAMRKASPTDTPTVRGRHSG